MTELDILGLQIMAPQIFRTVTVTDENERVKFIYYSGTLRTN
jgi:hypothetical protein